MTPSTETTLRFTGDWPLLPVIGVALGLSLIMYWLYQRESRGRAGSLWLPAMLRSVAVFVIVMALSGPVVRHVTTLRQLGRVVIALDASTSMKLTDDPVGRPPTTTRWQRMQDILFKGNAPLLRKLSEASDVELVALRGSAVQRLWWRRQEGKDTSGEMPSKLDLQPDAVLTDLDQALREALGPATTGSALVVLTDGQHNAPGSPEEFSASLKDSAVPIFTVGMGTEVPPPDLSIVDVSAPEAVFTAERVEGMISMRDSMPPGLPGSLRIESQGKLLWEQPFSTDGKGERRFNYSFLMKDMPAAAGQADKNLRLFNVVAGVNGEGASLEKTRANNSREVALHLLQKKRKLLMLDGRARWETRYAHNHFERDERWSVVTAFDDYGSGTGNSLAAAFPITKDELFTYDLVVIGDFEPSRLKPEHVEWLSEFVEKRGGGLVFIDGARGHLRSWSKSKAAGLVPVQWAAEAKGMQGPLTWHLTTQAGRAPALRLSDSPSANAALWAALPGSMWSAVVTASPGAETLATLDLPTKKSTPAVVFHSVGAGAVLYIASDELWRWRYQVADLYHQRLWMQVAAWIAAPPFQAEGKQIAIGTDRLRYAAGEQSEIRVRLRNAAGEIVADAHPRAFLIHEGIDAATLELEADPTHAGVYHALTPPLKAGEWQIAVSEAAAAARSDLRLTLRVADTGNQELASLTMNRPLLETMARNTNGRFLREEQAGELPGLLENLDRKQSITRETILWSSWWWLGAVMVLITTEWLVRKRLRLV
ncbi:MAG: hypothetical protein JWO94_417 [Verrucomicrobiaceae bacterium]|nr:hypothetical protein [Verrucomicrobiaceae bacterium]